MTRPLQFTLSKYVSTEFVVHLYTSATVCPVPWPPEDLICHRVSQYQYHQEGKEQTTLLHTHPHPEIKFLLLCLPISCLSQSTDYNSASTKPLQTFYSNTGIWTNSNIFILAFSNSSSLTYFVYALLNIYLIYLVYLRALCGQNSHFTFSNTKNPFLLQNMKASQTNLKISK